MLNSEDIVARTQACRTLFQLASSQNPAVIDKLLQVGIIDKLLDYLVRLSQDFIEIKTVKRKDASGKVWNDYMGVLDTQDIPLLPLYCQFLLLEICHKPSIQNKVIKKDGMVYLE